MKPKGGVLGFLKLVPIGKTFQTCDRESCSLDLLNPVILSKDDMTPLLKKLPKMIVVCCKNSSERSCMGSKMCTIGFLPMNRRFYNFIGNKNVTRSFYSELQEN